MPPAHALGVSCTLLIVFACGGGSEKVVIESESLEPSDENARLALIQRISRNGDINDPQTPRPLVSLEEFFEGNRDYGSIAYNFYPDQPPPRQFYEIFKSVRDREEVADVRVEVQDQIETTDWPATDTVWVMTTVDAATLQSWLGERFRGDDIVEGFPAERAYEPYEVPEGYAALGVWYD